MATTRAFEIDQDLKVDGNSIFNGDGEVTGNFQIMGNLQIGGSLLYDQEGTADFIPISSAYALGNTTNRWIGFFGNTNTTGTATFGSNVVFAAGQASAASFRAPHGVAPTTPVNGDFWTTSASVFMRMNGATKTLAFTDSNITGTANNATNLNGQAASYYLDVTNATGTLASARLSGSYAISITGTANNATNLNGQAASYYLDAGNLTGTVASARLSGSYGINITGSAATATSATSATTALTANNSTNLNGQAATFYTDIAARLGYTPVQQGTGIGQTTNLVKIGWAAGSRLKVTVDTTDIGNVVFDSNLAGASVAFATNATNATTLNGQAASYYLDATNMTGTIASARLSGTYGISITGSAGNASNLNGQAAAFYQNASNLNTGTVADARLPSSMAGKTFSSDTSVNGTLTATTVSGTTLSISGSAALPYNSTFAASGAAGGLLKLMPGSSTTLTGGAYLSQSGGIVQLYEVGGSNRGVYFDLASSAASAASVVWTAANFNPSNYLAVGATAANASALAGQAASYYLNVANANAGTLAAARLSGTYGISITGDAATVGSIPPTGIMRKEVATWHNSTDGVNRLFYTSGGTTSLNGTGGVNIMASGTTRMAVTTAGATLTGNLDVSGDVTAYSSSDRRLKMDIVPIASALEKIQAIGGYTYTRVDSGKREAGVIAQEIQAVLPEIVVEREHGVLAVDYPKLVALLIEAVKELADTTTK